MNSRVIATLNSSTLSDMEMIPPNRMITSRPNISLLSHCDLRLACGLYFSESVSVVSLTLVLICLSMVK